MFSYYILTDFKVKVLSKSVRKNTFEMRGLTPANAGKRVGTRIPNVFSSIIAEAENFMVNCPISLTILHLGCCFLY